MNTISSQALASTTTVENQQSTGKTQNTETAPPGIGPAVAHPVRKKKRLSPGVSLLLILAKKNKKKYSPGSDLLILA